jgi:hypothetical protein
MESRPFKIKIISVGPIQASHTAKGSTRKVTLTVEIQASNDPYGNKKPNAVHFDIDVYNANIEQFQISKNLEGETGTAEVMCTPFKREGSPAFLKPILTDLKFDLI